MGKSTISMTIFNSFLYVYQRVSTFLVSGSFMDTPFGGRWPPGNFPTSCMIKAPLIEEFQMPCLITRGYHRIPYIYIYILLIFIYWIELGESQVTWWFVFVCNSVVAEQTITNFFCAEDLRFFSIFIDVWIGNRE